jgi:hypothetical protein
MKGATRLTASVVLAPPALRGNQRPGLLHLPDGTDAYVDDALDLLGEWGFEYDVSQLFVLSSALAEMPDGRWAAKEVGLEEPRQNGKGEVLEGRECLGLFYLEERKLIHSAHEYATASEALDRMEDRIGRNPKLKARLRKNGVKRAHGEQGVYLKDGRSLQYKTRTKGGGRGFSADLLILDEAMYIAEAFLGALMPVISARPNPQMWYTGSAVNKATMDNGVVFARLRERALGHSPGRFAYFGWSAAYENGQVVFERPSDVPREVAGDPLMVARANPGLGPRADGGRIDLEHVLGTERVAMSHETFCVERLGVGDWPDTDEEADRKISRGAWASTLDENSRRAGPAALAFAVSEDGASAAIGFAGLRADGKCHGEVIQHGPGTAWVLPRLVEIAKGMKPVAVLYQSGTPAASLVAEAENLKIRKLEAVSTADTAAACGTFYGLVDHGEFKRGPQPMLDAAVDGAREKPSGDGLWLWSLKNSTADITPLQVVTLAAWAAMGRKKKRAKVVDLAAALAAAEAKEQT